VKKRTGSIAFLLAALGAGGMAYALTSGRAVTVAVLWGIASAVIGGAVLWLASLSSGKSPPDKSSSD